MRAANAPILRAHRATFVGLVLASLGSGCFAIFSLDGYGPPGDLIETDASDRPNDGATDASPKEPADAARGHRIFVTAAPAPGDFGGIDGGDVRCQSAATDAGLTGTYAAWLSDQTHDATARLLADAGPLRLGDGTLVAVTTGELTSAGPRVGIDLDEHGRRLRGDCDGGHVAWTDTWPDGGGLRNADCDSWTTSSAGKSAAVGMVGAKGTQWTLACMHSCASPAALYCIER